MTIPLKTSFLSLGLCLSLACSESKTTSSSTASEDSANSGVSVQSKLKDGFQPLRECAMGLGYLRCQKSQEAVMNLRKIVEAARVYYTSDHASRGSDVAIPNQFPGLGLDYGPAPGVNTCCGQPKDQCRSDPQAWDHPVWQALNFAVDGPHRYWYV